MPKVVSSDGFRITYESFGRDRPILLLHPGNATRRAWSDLGWVHALNSASHRVITLDSRGFGDSDRVSRPHDLPLERPPWTSPRSWTPSKFRLRIYAGSLLEPLRSCGTRLTSPNE